MFRYGVIWCNHKLKHNMCVHMLIIMLIIIHKEETTDEEFTCVGFNIFQLLADFTNNYEETVGIKNVVETVFPCKMYCSNLWGFIFENELFLKCILCLIQCVFVIICEIY